MAKSKKRGATMLVAGTCIGSGMIALPMILSRFGIIYSTALLLAIWFVTYYTALINIELNLRAGKGMTLVELAELFSGKITKIFSIVNLKIMSYLLLAAFIYGSASILQKIFFELSADRSAVDILIIVTGYSVLSAILLLLPVRYVDYVNRILFLVLIAVVFAMVFQLLLVIKYSDLPLFPEQKVTIWSIATVIPVIFTCFGFQVIFHTLTDYTNKNASFLRSAVLWGSFIPAVVYIVWNTSILSTIHIHNHALYEKMALGTLSVGELVYELGIISGSPYVQMLVWSISLLAIITSVIGIGMGLRDSIDVTLKQYVSNLWVRKIISVLMTIVPSYFMIFFVSDTFMRMLGLAGAMLVFIAIIIPIYLFYRSNTGKYFYNELRKNYLVIFSLVAGVVIVICQVISGFIRI